MIHGKAQDQAMASEERYSRDDWRVERVPLSTRTIRPDVPCGTAYDLLAAETDLPGLAVIDETGICGLIDRQSIQARFARPIMRDVYGGRPLALIMDKRPLMVDAAMRLDELSERVGIDQPSALTAGFIVTRNGAFVGVGMMTEVIRLAAVESRQRARAIEAAQQSLIQAEKLASLGALVAGVAHEINTPIGIGLTAASTLQDLTVDIRRQITDGALRKADLLAFLAMAGETSQLLVTHMHRAAELVQSFKQIAVDRTTAGRRRFMLRTYLDEVLVSLHPITKRGRVSVQLDCPDDLLLDTYPGALSQVVVNFVMNSMTHAYDGNAEGRLSLTIRRVDDDQIELTYADDGCGIAPENLPNIFDPFFTTRRGRGGSGLGLHIVYNIVTVTLGGRIEVESRLGWGTRFTLVLPIKAPEPVSEARG